jgi:hypothetical protein
LLLQVAVSVPSGIDIWALRCLRLKMFEDAVNSVASYFNLYHPQQQQVPLLAALLC